MKQRFSTVLKALWPFRSLHFNRQSSVFLVCLFISFLVWSLIKLSKEDTFIITFPVHYYHPPSGFQLIEKSDTIINVEVVSRGFDIIGEKYLNHRTAVSINISDVRLRESGTQYKTYLLTSGLLNLLSRKMQGKTNIVSVFPDTLKLGFEPTEIKTLAIIPDIDFSLEKQFMISDSLEVFPDSAVLVGVKSVLDTLNHIYTDHIVFPQLKQSLSVKLALNTYNGLINVSPDSARLEMGIERFTEANLELPVQPVYDDKGRLIKTFPDRVNVSFIIGMDDYKKLDTTFFEVLPSYPPKCTEAGILSLILNKKPDYVQKVKLQPDKVEYLIVD